ncbi:MAG TPA: hypothetical protein VF173_36080 [Thermoanaerobaculia bacterium]|nr:hypothetical protein [Thermoanaerobaculia bacterium]
MWNNSSRNLPGAILLATALLGCRHPSPEDELAGRARLAASWAASLQMLGEKWLANSVPTTFVRDTCAAAGDDLAQADEDAAKSQAAPAQKDRLRQSIALARTAAKALKRDAEDGDRPGAAREVQRLADLKSTLTALAREGEP